jgi:hypothetical protein
MNAHLASNISLAGLVTAVVSRLAAAGYHRSQWRPAVPAGRSIQWLGP